MAAATVAVQRLQCLHERLAALAASAEANFAAAGYPLEFVDPTGVVHTRTVRGTDTVAAVWDRLPWSDADARPSTLTPTPTWGLVYCGQRLARTQAEARSLTLEQLGIEPHVNVNRRWEPPRVRAHNGLLMVTVANENLNLMVPAEGIDDLWDVLQRVLQHEALPPLPSPPTREWMLAKQDGSGIQSLRECLHDTCNYHRVFAENVRVVVRAEPLASSTASSSPGRARAPVAVAAAGGAAVRPMVVKVKVTLTDEAWAWVSSPTPSPPSPPPQPPPSREFTVTLCHTELWSGGVNAFKARLAQVTGLPPFRQRLWVPRLHESLGDYAPWPEALRPDDTVEVGVDAVMLPPAPFHFFVKTLWNGTLTLRVSHDSTVGDVKRDLQTHVCIPPDQQRLHYGVGTLADDARTLYSYRVQPEGTAHLMLRLCGGMYHATSGRDGFEALHPRAVRPVTPSPLTLQDLTHGVCGLRWSRVRQAIDVVRQAVETTTTRDTKR